MFMAALRFSLLRGIPQTIKINHRPLSRSMFWKPAISFCRHTKPRRQFNCNIRAHSALFTDEKERDLLDEKVIFVRDVPAKTPNIKEKIREYFSSFGEVENVRRKGADMMFVSFRSVESAKNALKDKHFFEGRWMTTLPYVKKGIWRGNSCKIKVEDVPQSMSEKELTSYFSKFGTVTNVDFIILDPDTLKRKGYCFVGFSNVDEAKKAALVQEHKLGANCLKAYLSNSKFSAVENTKEIIARSLPQDISVDDLKEYFAQYGAVEKIDLICQTLARPHTIYAFVAFQSPCSAEKASEHLIHTICSKKAVVQKSTLPYPIKNGDRKLFIEGFQPNTDPERVRGYFEEFGKLEYINKKAICPTGKTYAVFKSTASLQHVLRVKEHVLDGFNLKIRAVSWRKPTTLIEMADQDRNDRKRNGRVQ